MTERIVIGINSDVRRLLEKGTGDVCLDVTNPLGIMLLSHDNDSQGDWHTHAMQLCDSYSKGMIVNANRRKSAAQANTFLQDKYNSGIPVMQYAAIRMWNDYLYCYDHPMAADSFTSRASMICRVFRLFGDHKPWEYSSAEALQQSIRSNESSLELYTPRT